MKEDHIAPPPPHPPHWPRLLGLAAACCAVILLRQRYFPAQIDAVMLRPATGLAVAALLLWGWRSLWAVAVGTAAAATVLYGFGGAALAMTLAGTLGPGSGVYLLRRMGRFDPNLRRLADYVRLMLCTALAGGLVAALAATLTLVAVGPGSPTPPLHVLTSWWAGEALGIAMLTPLILVWRSVRRLWTPAAPWAETAVLLTLSFLAGQHVFFGWFNESPQPAGFWMFLFVTWAALRRERRGASAVLALFTLQALWGAMLQRGYGHELLLHDTALLWRYLLVLNCSGMTIACYVTEQRLRAAALLRDSLALRDRALEQVQEGVVLADAQRHVTFVNAAFEQLTGYARNELLGGNCSVLQGSRTSSQTAQAIRDCLAAQRPFRGEILNYRKDGGVFWNDLSITPIVDRQGNLLEFFGVQRDITAQREAAMALKRSQEQLSLVLKGTNDGVWDWDIATNTIERSSAWYHMLGYQPGEVEFSRANDHGVVHPDDLPLVNAKLKETLAGPDERYTMEMRLKHRQGHYISVLTRGFVLRDEQGHAVRACGTTTNLTEQKAKEAKIKLAAAVFIHSREGMTITDAQGCIIMVNKAFASITGYAEDEVLGKNPRVLSSGRHDSAYYSAMWQSIETEGHWEGEIWNRRKDGEIYCEWLSITAMRDGDGRISHYVGNFTDLSEVKAAESRVLWLSNYDVLTGLPNLALLRDRTEHSLSMVQRANEPLAMMMIGIDHFKSINDALGHEIGDQLLRSVAARLTESVRDQDTVARHSGKEFVLLLPGTSPEGAAHVARDLLWTLAQPYLLNGHDVTVTASIGIASHPGNGSDFDSLFKCVEIAMHRAQTSGRDNFHFYSDEMYQAVVAHDQMLKALRSAAAQEQFSLVYQPLVDLQTGGISGMEALLRWHSPELGEVSPARFIPVAEESGLIKAIGEWVLQRACRDIRTWLDKGLAVPHVAVNVSSLQFRDADLVGHVKAALAQFRVDPALLYLEVTESALMDDVPRSEALLHELKGLGVRLSLDDFGTGYSSLSYLKRFPFDKVKIDQSFVRDITTDQSDTVIVKVIVSMAHGLGLRVIAEGVETEAQCEIMRTSVCDEIQGYFFSRPITAQAIEEILTEGRQLPAHLLRLRKPERTMLLVDDEPNIVAALKRLFRRDGHHILTANSGAEGLEILAKNKVDLIVSDQRMPGMTGVEFLRAAKASHPETIRIVLSGYTELQSVTDAINEGAVYRFLTKPWDDEQLREHIRKAFEYKELQEENQQLSIRIRSTNQQLVAANRQLGAVLQKTQEQIERDNASLAIVREALQHLPDPVLGIDDEGIIAFANAATERLLASGRPLLGEELRDAVPALAGAMAETEEGVERAMSIGEMRYLLKWHTMGVNSRSKGRLLTLTRTGLNP